MLPIDKSLKEGERSALSVKVPENFKALQPVGQIGETGMAEFIPNDDKDPFAWTQILTISNMPTGEKTLAKDLLASFKKGFIAADPNMKVMEESYDENSGYNMGKLVMSYTPGKSRNEMVIMQYYCGTQECSGMQYAILLKPDEDKAAALIKMHGFLDANKVATITKF